MKNGNPPFASSTEEVEEQTHGPKWSAVAASAYAVWALANPNLVLLFGGTLWPALIFVWLRDMDDRK